MAKIGYNWIQVKQGDIISFQYRGKDKRLLRRTVLVLEVKVDGLLHGILLERSNRIVNSEVKKVLEIAGKTQVIDAKKKVYKVKLDGKSKDVYKNNDYFHSSPC